MTAPTGAPLEILMVSDVYFPRINGVSTSIQAFRRELEALGHRVTLVAPEYGRVYDDDGDTFRVPANPVINDPEDRLMVRQKLRKQLQRLNDRSFDVVHVQTPFIAHYAGTAYARQRGIPCVETYHTFFEEYFHHYVRWLPGKLLRFAVRCFTRSQARAVDLMLVPSTAMQARLHDYGVRTPVQVLPTGIDTNEFCAGSNPAIASRLGMTGSQPKVVHVGRIAFEKNLDFLLDAMHLLRKRVPDFLLVIAGEGPALEHVRKRCADLGLSSNVRLLGNLSRNGELQTLYQQGDVFVFASKTETQGLVLLESMASGLPVVALAEMGTRDILGPGLGALVAEENSEDFSEKVARILADEALRGKLSRDARAYAEQWTARRFAGQLVSVYRELAGRMPVRKALSDSAGH